jgi:voltage-gated potassium channel
MTASRVERWEQRSEWPLAILAGLFLTAYSWDVLDDNLGSPWRETCLAVDYSIWAIFAIDLVCRIALAEDHFRYWYRHLLDLIVIALPVLRPVRLLLPLRMLSRRATTALRGRLAAYVIITAVLLVYTASLAILDAERHHPDTNINSFGDAIWWSSTTVTTVGYGDRFPVTTEGRFVAVGLMVGGIALIGVVTASFATWLLTRVQQVEEGAETATRRDLRAVHTQLDRIERRLDAIAAIRDRETDAEPQGHR